MTMIDLSDASRARGGSEPLHAYLARPATGEGPWPGVVVVHEAFGLTDVQQRHADRMARAGYLALAVDLFSQGGARRCLVSTLRSATSGQGRAYTDIETGRLHLRESADCTGKVGVIGFCMGGGFALQLANRGEYDVASVNYGMLPHDVDAAMAGACPVVASYGARDQLKGAAATLDEALTRAGVVHDVKEYPTAGHAFLNDAETGPRVLRPLMRVTHMGPDPQAAEDAWQRIDAFFAAQLGG
jgi:carboxymethylenebutenolidase